MLHEAYANKLLTQHSPEKARIILTEALLGFYHPRVLVLHLHEKRELILKPLLETLPEGLR